MYDSSDLLIFIIAAVYKKYFFACAELTDDQFDCVIFNYNIIILTVKSSRGLQHSKQFISADLEGFSCV